VGAGASTAAFVGLIDSVAVNVGVSVMALIAAATGVAGSLVTGAGITASVSATAEGGIEIASVGGGVVENRSVHADRKAKISMGNTTFEFIYRSTGNEPVFFNID
jgi:hypothetical protein